MKKLIIIATAALPLFAAASLPAAAESEASCGPVSGQWMSEDAVKTKVSGMGYDVRRVKREGNCYEVYALKDGAKAELYLNPVSGEIVRNKVDD